ncbi:MAG: ABC transporter substrate-binding protein [Chloroflexota bacterium]
MGRLIAAAGIWLLLAGCSPAQSAATSLTAVNVGMGYIANVQFAPFYLAQARGYYRGAGLNVRFSYAIEPDLLHLAAQGKLDFVDSGGDEVLAAGAHGVRVKYVMTQYSRFPSALFALASSHIHRPSDLRGKSIAIPGRYGASYVGLLALLRAGGLLPSQVSIHTAGFSQAQLVAHHRVDAAVGYAMNEPLQLRASGHHVDELDLYHWANFAGAGIAVGDAEIVHHPKLVRAFVSATIHGLRDTLAQPAAAFRAAERAVPEIKVQAGLQRAVLRRCLAFWRAEPAKPLGYVDPRIWQNTARLLYSFHQIPSPVNADRFFTNRFVS